MRHFQILFSSVILLTCAATAQQTAGALGPGNSGDVSAMEQKIRDLEDRLVMLEGQVRQLKAQGAQAPSQNAAALATDLSAPTGQTQVTAPEEAIRSAPIAGDNVRLGGAGGAAAKALNPDISVIGDFIGSAGRQPGGVAPLFRMRESHRGGGT